MFQTVLQGYTGIRKAYLYYNLSTSVTIWIPNLVHKIRQPLLTGHLRINMYPADVHQAFPVNGLYIHIFHLLKIHVWNHIHRQHLLFQDMTALSVQMS